MVKARLPFVSAKIHQSVDNPDDYITVESFGRDSAKIRTTPLKTNVTLSLELKVPKEEASKVFELIQGLQNNGGELQIGLPETLLREPAVVGKEKEAHAEIGVSDVYQDKW